MTEAGRISATSDLQVADRDNRRLAGEPDGEHAGDWLLAASEWRAGRRQKKSAASLS